MPPIVTNGSARRPASERVGPASPIEHTKSRRRDKTSSHARLGGQTLQIRLPDSKLSQFSQRRDEIRKIAAGLSSCGADDRGPLPHRNSAGKTRMPRLGDICQHIHALRLSLASHIRRQPRFAIDSINEFSRVQVGPHRRRIVLSHAKGHPFARAAAGKPQHQSRSPLRAPIMQ